MLATVSALAAQNIGAGKHDRASKTLKYAILITFTYGIIVAIIGELITAGIVASSRRTPRLSCLVHNTCVAISSTVH